jgi:pentatricopeptide repeat protein
MYRNACLVFDKISQGDIATWNAMIARYDMHGHGGDSIELIDKMKEVGFIPNHITFIDLFSTCNHAGIIDEGWKSFDCII